MRRAATMFCLIIPTVQRTLPPSETGAVLFCGLIYGFFMRSETSLGRLFRQMQSINLGGCEKKNRIRRKRLRDILLHKLSPNNGANDRYQGNNNPIHGHQDSPHVNSLCIKKGNNVMNQTSEFQKVRRFQHK